MRYYSVYDKLDNSFSTLMGSPSEASFFRKLNDLPEGMLWKKHPADFSVYYMLEVDDNTGRVKELFDPICLVNSLVPVFSKEDSHE